MHVKKADEAYCLGEEPLTGYLNPQLLVNVAILK
jgi:pyruvate carboxylase subunit A